MGGKYKLLPQILPLFPKDINRFIDLFGGGFNVGINVSANKVYYNDINIKVVNIFKYFKSHSVDNMLNNIDNLINKFNLSKTNRQGYLDLRYYYNQENKNPIILYTLICYAFNNQIRFNNKGEYNMPFGKDRSSFNPTLRKRFIKFINALHNKDCTFCNFDFSKLKTDKLNKNDFVYCDPPYFNTIATYNENDGWNKEREKVLRELLERLNDRNIRFALSNNLATNTTLEDWAVYNKFNIHYLNYTYNNCNYQKKVKNKKDVEVLITNY